MSKADIGLTGLAVMGQNLVLNMESRGFTVAAHNRTVQTTHDFVAAHPGKKLVGCDSLADFVAALSTPRKIMVMVKAGAPVDQVIESLTPLLAPGDMIIDGGNSFFQDTERRSVALEKRGFRFIGTGVSGGEEGALHGPAIMPGGTREAYDAVGKILRDISAKVGDEPCCAYIGPDGAGHYVKMVHNGIEYGDMELIAETYDLLHRGLGLTAPELHQIFAEWNTGELKSYLIEITADIFTKVDEGTGKPLVDMILDEAQQKGTGKWTSQNALDVGAPLQTINAAVESRITSALKPQRVAASKVIRGPKKRYRGQRQKLVDATRAALYASKICSYAQGMGLLKIASDEYKYDLRLGEIAKIWRAGCIIRASLLSDITQAFQRNTGLVNLLLDDAFRTAVEERQEALRFVVQTGVGLGIPVLALSASLGYFDAYRTERLPANLTQAQRDYFGAHTYRRIDKEGSFHTEWMK
jgi:6-phosphogluconate dehydrogenase